MNCQGILIQHQRVLSKYSQDYLASFASLFNFMGLNDKHPKALCFSDMIRKKHYKKVISASRRVDLVAFYPDYMVERLEEIGVENIHTLVIWTKNPQNILAYSKLNHALKKLDQVYVLLTITGLGGTPLEPNAPSTDHIFHQLPSLIDFLGSAQRLAIRYDPLIDVIYRDKVSFSNLDLSMFTDIMNRAHYSGVKRVIVSYVTLYQKVEKRLKANGFRIVEHPKEEIVDFIRNQMIPGTEELGMELSTCVLPNLTSQGCIDGRTLSLLHPLQEPCSQARDQTQRADCHCTKSLDIGQWFACYHDCLYCYGNPTRNS